MYLLLREKSGWEQQNECNKMLLHLLIRKNNIFSLNMADNEVGRTNCNTVAKMVQLLETFGNVPEKFWKW